MTVFMSLISKSKHGFLGRTRRHGFRTPQFRRSSCRKHCFFFSFGKSHFIPTIRWKMRSLGLWCIWAQRTGRIWRTTVAHFVTDVQIFALLVIEIQILVQSITNEFEVTNFFFVCYVNLTRQPEPLEIYKHPKKTHQKENGVCVWGGGRHFKLMSSSEWFTEVLSFLRLSAYQKNGCIRRQGSDDKSRDSREMSIASSHKCTPVCSCLAAAFFFVLLLAIAGNHFTANWDPKLHVSEGSQTVPANDV